MKKILLKQAKAGKMVKIVVIWILFLLSIQVVSAQKADTPRSKPASTTYDFHMRRYTVKNVIGLGLLGSGLTMTFMGLHKIQNSGDSYIFPTDQSTRGVGLFIAGTGTALLSIPFFISAGSSKRKAKLSLKTNSVGFGGSGANDFNYMAIALKVHF